MFRLMRDVHLILGLVFFAFAIVFAVSSLVFIYRPFLPQSSPRDEERTVRIDAQQATTPRSLALTLMRNNSLTGDLRDIEQSEGEIRFSVARPGTRAQVRYSSATGEATISTRTLGFLETLVQLHVNHGFWHDFLPSNGWAMLSLLGSIGLFLLGATGIYLWFCHHEERLVGGVLLVVGLAYAFATLALSRTAG
jgi:hypothetical protein